MAELIIQTGKHQGRKLKLPDTTGDVIFGRNEDCQVRLTSAEVSKQHCALRSTPAGLVVRDLGSRNGTFVNEVRIEVETSLRPGDSLRVGNMVFQLAGTSTPKPRQAAKKGNGLSDDDIASWLSDDGLPTTGSSDSTIISTPPQLAAAAAQNPSQSAAARETAAGEPKKFKNVAEEAADVIRRWWQSQENKRS
ncbi:MAG: FHA domain-containing protein [Planctomycetes bacterium]|nr:FHA domain-containing protein [Planctomycetota bacterium]